MRQIYVNKLKCFPKVEVHLSGANYLLRVPGTVKCILKPLPWSYYFRSLKILVLLSVINNFLESCRWHLLFFSNSSSLIFPQSFLRLFWEKKNIPLRWFQRGRLKLDEDLKWKNGRQFVEFIF